MGRFLHTQIDELESFGSCFLRTGSIISVFFFISKFSLSFPPVFPRSPKNSQRAATALSSTSPTTFRSSMILASSGLAAASSSGVSAPTAPSALFSSEATFFSKSVISLMISLVSLFPSLVSMSFLSSATTWAFGQGLLFFQGRGREKKEKGGGMRERKERGG